MPTDASIPSTPGRPSKGADFYRALFDEQKQSGVSVKKIAERENIPYTTLMYWRKRLGLTPKKAVANVQMMPVEFKAPASTTQAFELQTPAGFTLRIPANFCATTLQRIVAALQEAC